jgi:hypothetical protein
LHPLFDQKFLRFEKRGSEWTGMIKRTALPSEEAPRLPEEVFKEVHNSADEHPTSPHLASADEWQMPEEIEAWLITKVRFTKVNTKQGAPLRKLIEELDLVEVNELAALETEELKQLVDAVKAKATKNRWVWVKERV